MQSEPTAVRAPERPGRTGLFWRFIHSPGAECGTKYHVFGSRLLTVWPGVPITRLTAAEGGADLALRAAKGLGWQGNLPVRGFRFRVCPQNWKTKNGVDKLSGLH